MPAHALLISDAWFARGPVDLHIPEGDPVGFSVGVIPATPINLAEAIELSIAREAITRGLIIGKELP